MIQATRKSVFAATEVELERLWFFHHGFSLQEIADAYGMSRGCLGRQLATVIEKVRLQTRIATEEPMRPKGKCTLAQARNRQGRSADHRIGLWK